MDHKEASRNMKTENKKHKDKNARDIEKQKQKEEEEMKKEDKTRSRLPNPQRRQSRKNGTKGARIKPKGSRKISYVYINMNWSVFVGRRSPSRIKQ